MENKKYGSIRYVAVDFDNTITEHAEFPSIGRLRFKAKEVLQDFKDNGLTVIIWSCRTGKHQEALREWLNANKVPYDYINENPACPEAHEKVFADAYIDDRAVAFDGDFEKLQTDLIGAGVKWPEHVIVPTKEPVREAHVETTFDAIEGLRYYLNNGTPTEQIVEFVLTHFTTNPTLTK